MSTPGKKPSGLVVPGDDNAALTDASSKRRGRGAKKLLMVGLSCIDHIWQIGAFPPTDSRTHASAYRTQGGGPAATAAVAASKLGAQVELWSIHGDDPNGQQATAELEAFGVNCDHVRVPPESQTIVSGILVASDGERYIFPYFGSGLEDSAEGFELSRVAEFDCVLTDARHPVMNEAVLKEAKRQGVPVVGDFGNTRNWHLAEYVDYLIASEECAREVLGTDDPEAASLAELRQAEGQLVGVTLGENGFVYEHEGEFRHIPAFPVNVVDTTGAGDVFHGAYAYAVANGWDVGKCGLFASVTAALKCTALGGRTGIPTAEEVEHLLVEKTAREMDELKWA